MGTWSPNAGGPTSGNDTFTGDGTGETANGGIGNDTLNGNGGADTLNGGAGHDTLDGGEDNDNLYGDIGDDVVEGGAGDDTFYDGAGADVFHGGEGADIINTGADYFMGDHLYGDGGNDNFAGSVQGSVFINGGSGDDDLYFFAVSLGVAANVTLNGGDGADIIHAVSFNPDAVFTVSAGIGDDQVVIDASSNVSLGAGSDELFVGDGWAANVLDFDAGLGGDLYDATYYSTPSGGTENPFNTGIIRLFQTGADTLFQWDDDGGGDNYETIFTFQNTHAGDFIAENFGGWTPSVFIQGEHGPETLTGGEGDDIISPATGPDTIDGGAGFDLVWYNLAVVGVSVTLDGATGFADAGATVGTTIANVEGAIGSSLNDTLIGEAGVQTFYGAGDSDRLLGGDANDFLYGEAGNDSLFGEAGADTMRGGAGDDSYSVDNINDSVVEELDAGIDLVLTWRSWAVSSNIERLWLAGTGDYNLAGNGLANNIRGNSGDNWLNGSFGKDTLTGGGGRDSFIFNRELKVNNVDTITDYDVIRDVIRIDNAVFAGIGPAGALAAGAYNAGAVATEADDRIIYDAVTGNLFFDIDGVGGQAQVRFANLQNRPAELSAAEFIII